MNPLLVKALLRTAFFIAWSCFSAWLFVQVEHTENDFVDEKYQLLRSLYISRKIHVVNPGAERHASGEGWKPTCRRSGWEVP